MPGTRTTPASTCRIIRRKRLGQPSLIVPALRPSVLDVTIRGDAWISSPAPDTLWLLIGDQRLASFDGSSLEGAALNQLLNTMRHRPPRRKERLS
jgi:hypothetical protein